MKVKGIKILAFTTAMCFLMTACTSSPPEDKTSNVPESKTNTSDTASKDEALPKEKDYSEHMVISHALVGQLEGVDYNGDALAKVFEDKLNFEWESVNLTWDSWKEKANIWINSNDLPDMMQWDFNYADYMNYTGQELLRKLPDDWRERWPNVARIAEVSGINETLDKKSNGTYFIPKATYFNAPTDPVITHNSLILRKDWLKTAGLEQKDAYTVNELMEFARLVKKADPAGNGRTIPIDGVISDLSYIFMEQANVNFTNFYAGSDGKYKWGPADPGTLEGLKLWQQAYKEGLLNKDFYSESIMVGDNFYSGISGSMFGSCTAHSINLIYDEYTKASKRDPAADLQVSFMVDEEGKHNTREIKNFWTGTIISPKVSEEKFERIMDILDFSASDEGQNLTRLGIEGVDYSMDASGTATILREKNPDGSYPILSDKYPSLLSLFNNLSILPDDFSLRDPTIAPERLKVVSNGFAKKKELGIDKGTVPALDWDLIFFTSPTFEKFQPNYTEEYAKLVLAEGDLEANWKAWIESKSTPVTTILEELNSMKK